MSVVNDIIDVLKTDMIKYIKTSRDYLTDPNIRYGVYMHTEVDSFPFVGFCEDGIEIESLMGGYGIGSLNILLYGYANWGGIETNSTIRDLALDVMHFIHTDFTYTNDTDFTSKLEILPGNDNHPVSVFSVEIKIKFGYEYSTINN